MATELYAVIRRDGSSPTGQAANTSAKPSAQAKLVATYPLAEADVTIGSVSILLANSLEALRSAASEAVTASDEVTPLPERCLTGLTSAAIENMLGTPPSAMWREISGRPPPFDQIPDQIDEQALEIPAGSTKKPAAGIIVVDQEGLLTIVEPLNHYGGYEHTYPKGHAHPDRETLQQTAHRELFEETGLYARIVGLVGDFPGDTTITRYYLGGLLGGTPTVGPETAALKTVGPLQALELVNKQRDKDVLVRLVEVAAAEADWTWTLNGRSWRCQLVGGRVQLIPDADQFWRRELTVPPEGDPGTGVWAAQFGPG